MSELKAIDDLYERRIRNGSDPYKIKLVDVRHPPVYLKSEADKVIARHKYKRCLAMAMMLEHICPITIRKAKWKGKWHLRWLELSEKFKEADK